MPLGEVQRPQLRCSLSPFGVGSENGSHTFTLRTNHSTHGSKPEKRPGYYLVTHHRSHVVHFGWRILTSRLSLEVRIYYLAVSRKYRVHFTHGKREHIIASFFQQIRLERSRSRRIIRASEIPCKYPRSQHQTEEDESGSRL